jgi:hypothetical protein
MSRRELTNRATLEAMIISSHRTARLVRLYRGDTLERCAAIRRTGIRADGDVSEHGFPSFPHFALSRLPPQTLQLEADRHVLAHVVRRRESPFVSMTSSEAIARGYALAGGRRREGMLIGISVFLRESHAWHVPGRGTSVVYLDARGRRWLNLSQYRSSSPEAFIRSAAWRTFDTNAARDQEWLFLGRLEPAELSLRKVTTSWWEGLLAS